MLQVDPMVYLPTVFSNLQCFESGLGALEGQGLYANFIMDVTKAVHGWSNLRHSLQERLAAPMVELAILGDVVRQAAGVVPCLSCCFSSDYCEFLIKVATCMAVPNCHCNYCMESNLPGKGIWMDQLGYARIIFQHATGMMNDDPQRQATPSRHNLIPGSGCQAKSKIL